MFDVKCFVKGKGPRVFVEGLRLFFIFKRPSVLGLMWVFIGGISDYG